MAVILLYHRIAVSASDPWGLCVSPRNFRAHLDVLRRHTSVVPLERLAAAYRDGVSLARMCAVTFDDGYADAWTEALPALEAHDAPATFYVPGTGTPDGREFWWDDLDGLLLQPGTLPGRLTATLGDRVITWSVEPDETLSPVAAAAAAGWRAWDPPPTRRHALYAELWQRLQVMSHAARERAIDELWHSAGGRMAARATHRRLSAGEMAGLAASALVSIGGHTATHARLSVLSGSEQREEIQTNLEALERTCPVPITSFAYPFGGRSDYTAETVDAVMAAGYTNGCCNWPGRVETASSAFELPRCFVADLPAASFEAWWRSLDA
jgi:peptidoglycan/xylan/chitin deacetylase (PgdA/CDA1 family)